MTSFNVSCIQAYKTTAFWRTDVMQYQYQNTKINMTGSSVYVIRRAVVQKYTCRIV